MTRKVSLYAVIAALTVGVSIIISIPVPGTNNFFTLADAGIYIASLLFGPLGGLTVGALSGSLIDLLTGNPQWLIFSLVIHGLQDWLVGYFSTKGKGLRYLGLVLGGILMVIGYALATSLLTGIGSGLLSIPINCLQTLFGAMVAVPLSKAITQALPNHNSKKEGIRHGS